MVVMFFFWGGEEGGRTEISPPWSFLKVGAYALSRPITGQLQFDVTSEVTSGY